MHVICASPVLLETWWAYRTCHVVGDLLQLKRAVQHIAQSQDKNTVLEQPAREALQYLAALGAH